MKHTKGPWTIYGGTIGVLDGAGIFPIAKSVHKENARLIAAAPDMLEALKGLFEHCAMVHKHWGDGNNTKQADAAIKAGEAAIAKAEGRQ